MANRPDLDDDDDFSDIYKAYTGPLGTSAAKVEEKPQTNNKRSHSGSDEDNEERDPNAIPMDFTSRDAKVWEAKSKATERNWKKRKEEEMICKICGESGHFTQGCPSTIGGIRNSQDFFERVAARDKHVRRLFTEQVIERIERDIGCKIKMDEKFIIVSGKDRLVLRKGVDAVHKVKEESNERNSPGSQAERSRSPERSPVEVARFTRSESLRSRSPVRSPVGAARFSRSESQRSHFQRFSKQDRDLADRILGDLQKSSVNSPQARAYVSDGGRGRASQSRSPARVSYSGSSYNTHGGQVPGNVGGRSDEKGTIIRGSDFHSDLKFDHPLFPQTLEDLEMEYQREASDLAQLRNQQLGEETYKHDKIVRELRESYMNRLTALRGSHTKDWEDFLQLDAQRRKQQVEQQRRLATDLGSYQHPNLSDYDSLGKQPYAKSNFHREPREQYTSPSNSYPHSRPRDAYDDFNNQRLDGYGRAYNRY